MKTQPEMYLWQGSHH